MTIFNITLQRSFVRPSFRFGMSGILSMTAKFAAQLKPLKHLKP